MKTILILLETFIFCNWSSLHATPKDNVVGYSGINEHVIIDTCKECDSLLLDYQNWLELDAEKDYNEVTFLVKCALEKNCNNFYALYGENLIFNFYPDRNIELGKAFLEKAYRNGNNDAGFALVKYFLSIDSYYKAIDNLNILHNRGYKQATFELSYILLKERSFYLGEKLNSGGELIDIEKGVYLLEQSASNGNIDAQIELGLAYKNGKYNLSLDASKADSLFHQAYENPQADTIPGIRDDIRFHLEGIY